MSIRSFLQGKERAALSIAAIVTVVIWGWALWPRQPVMTVTFLNVGQGDAIFVRTPSGRAVLIDAGPGEPERGGFDAGAKIIVPFLRGEGINRLDALVLTHPHEDHVGGAPSVVRNLDVRRVLDPGIAHPSGRYREVLELVEDRSIDYQRIRRGHIIDFHDGASMEVLNPPRKTTRADDDAAVNELSVVLLLKYRDVRLLLTGDAGKQAEGDMLSSCPELSAHVLKVGHHGSAQGTTTEWIAAVRPRIAVISVGYKNPFGHPNAKTVDRLEDSGAEVYRTDFRGGITVTTDGRRLSLATSK